MRKLLLITGLLTLVLTPLSQLKASHNQGMNITYNYVGEDSLEITVDFWRYCGGTAFSPTGNPQSAAGAGNTVNATFFCDAYGFSQNVTLQKDTFYEASPICEAQSFLSSCPPNGSYQTGLLGIEWHIYKGVVDISTFAQSTCDEWLIYTTICCRNSGTNYTSQPGLVAFAKWRQNEFPTNSAVNFTTVKPIPFFCEGQQVTYNWGAIELDGDSLHWELDTAWASFNTTSGPTYVTYNTAYYAPTNGTEPIPGITIDSITGQVQFLADIPPGYNFANFAVAVRVDEYDYATGDYIGSVHRDAQFIVLDSCDNNPPVDPLGIQNFQGSGALIDSNTVEVCFGQDFEFDILIYDYDSVGNLSTDSLTISCNIDQILPGAQWTTSGTNPDTVHISWVSVPTQLSLVPFNITVEDDNCPITGFNIYNYKIRIVPSTFLGPDTAICSLDTISLNANGGDTFYWSTLQGDPIITGGVNQNFGCVECPNPWIHPSQTTTYVVTSNLSATCGNTDTITITVFDQFPVSITPANGGTVDTLVYCASDPLDTMIAQTPGGTYIGPGIVNTIDGVFAPDILDPGFGNDSVITISYILEGVCANTHEIPVRVKGLPDARVLTEGPLCALSTADTLVGYSAGGTWSGLNVDPATGVINPSLFTAPDTVLIHHTVDDSGCVFTDSAMIRIIEEYNSAIDSLPKICVGEEVTIYLNDFEGDPFGEWTGKEVYEDPIGSGEYYFTTDDLKPGKYDITYEIKGECGTQTTDELLIHALPDASIFGADSVYCDNIEDSVLLKAATPNGIWGGTMNELHDGYFVPGRLGEGLYTISYELYDTVSTCYNKNVVEVRIARTPVQPKLYGGGPYCQGTNLRVRADGLLSNTFLWYSWDGADSLVTEDFPTTADMNLLGAGNPFTYGELVDMPTRLYGTQMSEYGCESGWTRLYVEVKPSPQALFEPDSIVGNVPFNVQFENLSGPDGMQIYYTWTFGPYEERQVDDPKTQEFTFEDIGDYLVTLVADNGQCVDSHIIMIRADRQTAFFIPNVFTPNADNENDLFTWEIEGINDFQIVIYNRWGTKVFGTDDITEFWDGAKEPEGTYYYVVKGREKTLGAEPVEWRGDLTLVRD
ncbi:MAG: T9SS type B sorting domain-containing protein [Flavobacteriales bacterium]|nr:T9SS type B sorting domain-containing protein [Flavobacteriales bacterium]